MKLKVYIVISIVLIFNIIFYSTYEVQSANTTSENGISDIFSGAQEFIDAGSSSGVAIDEGKLQNASTLLFNILFSVGMVVAVIMAGILGIKFMLGSVEEKAEIKETLMPFIIGCIVVFGAFGIWKIFITIGNQL